MFGHCACGNHLNQERYVDIFSGHVACGTCKGAVGLPVYRYCYKSVVRSEDLKNVIGSKHHQIRSYISNGYRVCILHPHENPENTSLQKKCYNGFCKSLIADHFEFCSVECCVRDRSESSLCFDDMLSQVLSDITSSKQSSQEEEEESLYKEFHRRKNFVPLCSPCV